jgi:tryptophan-rich sensory protein
MSPTPKEIKTPSRNWGSLAAFLLLTFAIEIIGGIWTRESVETWYPTLNKPSWTPPGWVFGPVWSTLYLMIAVSGWLLYTAEPSPKRTQALWFYALQLACNFIWSFLFFSLRNPGVALIDSVLILVFLILTITAAWKVRPLAAWLLIPYLVWALYATSLNLGTWLLN